MHDRPTAAELLTAVRQFLERELTPTLNDARLRYQLLVATHALAVVERELPRQEADLQTEARHLARLLGSADEPPASMAQLRQTVQMGNRELCERIRAGRYDGREQMLGLLRELRPLVQQKLEVARGT